MTDEAPWRALADGIEVRVRVTPRGGRDALEGIEARADGRPALKLRVRAAPEGGAANAAARALLAKTLRRPTSAVTLAAGAASRLKTFRIAGDPAALAAALARTAPGPTETA
jgi:uncharacterized protein YggU (UPF0235/DUF167 family)